MQVEMKQVVELFTAMGYQKASSWSREKMSKKLLTLSDAAADCPDLGTATLDNLLDSLLSSDEVITLTEESASITDAHDQTEQEAEEVTDEKPKKKKKKGNKGKNKDKRNKAKKDKPEPKEAKKDKPKEAAVKPPTRVGLTAKYVMSCSQPITMEEIVKGGDSLHEANGGTSNEKEALYAARLALQVLEAIDAVSIDDGVVTVK